MWHGMWNWEGGWGWFGAMHLLWWVLVFVAVAAVLRLVPGRRPAGWASADRSLSILRERYARGEIDQREYDERLRCLAGPGDPR